MIKIRDEMALCGTCTHLLSENNYVLRRIGGGINAKVVCELCGKRRFGGRFTVERMHGKHTIPY